MIVAQGPPENFLKWIELFSPIVAGMSFFVGLFVRGRLNDKAIRDLTTAVTEILTTISQFRLSISALEKFAEDSHEDAQDMSDQQQKNTDEIHKLGERVARLEGIDEGQRRHKQ